MFQIEVLPGFIMGIREGLEAFLIIAIMLEYLRKSNRSSEQKHVWTGLIYGIVGSVLFGLMLFGLSLLINQSSDSIGKLWESIASFVALILITTFIYYMIAHKNTITGEIKEKVGVTVTKWGIISLAAIMVAREGVEISLFIFASTNQGAYIIGALIGIFTAVLVTFLISKSLIKINLKVIFNITLIYLILQAGFMLGYGIHEFLSFLKDEGVISATSGIFTKLFNLSGTFLDHKTAPLGIFLYVTIGYYSKPEIIQFIAQYLYTASLLIIFFKKK